MSQMAASQIELFKEAVRLQHEGTPFCIVTLADARGSIPQEVGAKAIVGREGLVYGTIGGGKVEARACEKGRALLTPASDRQMLLERINLHRDVGMTCAGEMTLLYEVFRPDFEWSVAIFGAGHVAQKLCRLLIELECRITCFDTRPQWLQRLPENGRLERRLVADFPEGVESIARGAFVVVMTMGHATDLPVLRALWQRQTETGFIGVLGSDSKAAIMRRELKQAGLAEDFISRVNCPIGEKIGDNTPPEIAVSVLAQLLRVRGKSR
jgi:xanthine dehydrogenase accessory factor